MKTITSETRFSKVIIDGVETELGGNMTVEDIKLVVGDLIENIEEMTPQAVNGETVEFVYARGVNG